MESSNNEAFITGDGVLISGRGFFDPVDVTFMKGRRVMSMADMLEHVKADFEARPSETKPPAGTYEDLARLSREAPEAYEKLKRQIEPFVLASPSLVTAIRRKRVDERYSWRALARWAYPEPDLNYGRWFPVSNQLAGRALCEIAAMCEGEDFLAPPWNPVRDGQV